MKKNQDIELDDADIIEDEITRNGMSLEEITTPFPLIRQCPIPLFPSSKQKHVIMFRDTRK